MIDNALENRSLCERVTDSTWKLGAPEFQHMMEIVGFEISVMGLMKGNQNGHDLADSQGTGSPMLLLSADELLAFPNW